MSSDHKYWINLFIYTPSTTHSIISFSLQDCKILYCVMSYVDSIASPNPSGALPLNPRPSTSEHITTYSIDGINSSLHSGNILLNIVMLV